MTNRKIVLTGGTGFILSHVAERYAALGDEVLMFDQTAPDQLPPYAKNILESNENTAYFQGDIRERDAVEEIIGGADIVYHFAALMGTSSRFKQEVLTTEVNVIGTLHACQAALDAGAQDVESGDDGHDVFCAPDDFNDVRDSLETRFAVPEQAGLTWRAQNSIELDEDGAEKLFRLLEVLDDNDDVQSVSANFSVSDDIMAKLMV